MLLTTGARYRQLRIPGVDDLIGVCVHFCATCDGVFVFIGHSPNSDLMKDMVKIDDYNFLVTDKTMMTSLPGLFAAGDVRADSTKQATSAVGEGTTAVIMIRKYLEENG